MSDDSVRLVTDLPGPKAQAVIERGDRATSPSLARAFPLVAKRAQGLIVEDVDGNRFLDFAAGIAVCATGHCHPRVVKAVQEQASRFLHIYGGDCYDFPYVELAERLIGLAPGDGPKKAFLANSGTEVVEAALKLVRDHTGRSQVIAFLGAFHGRTMGSVALTASKPLYRGGFGPLVGGITHVPYAYCYRCAYNLTYPECDLACVDYIESIWFSRTIRPQDVAAVFVEPVQGEGGYVVPPPGWLPKLRALCDKYDILLVADEVQCGVGRTGKMFAVEHWGVEPDIICLAKALASGMPLSAMIAREEIIETWSPGEHGNTYGGNPVSCAAALATLDVIEEEGLMENATRVGERLRANLRDLAQENRLIGDVRGLGLMTGVELVRDRGTKEPARQQADQLVQACFERGMLVLRCGPGGIRLSPALIVTEAQADEAFGIFAEALAAV